MTSLPESGFVGCCIVILFVSACSASSRDPVNASQVDNAHGFKVGDTIAPLGVDCLKQRGRVLGAQGATQLVTFSSPGDCSTCMLHLAGMEKIAREGNGPRENFIVSWGPGLTLSDVGRLYSSHPVRDVCTDSGGKAWDALNLEHTPVTVLLISGRVALMTDKGYGSDSSRAHFLDDIRLIAPP